jgi:putative nucleotidyltransferase with HDIG domain
LAEAPKTQAAEAVERPRAAQSLRSRLQRTLAGEAFQRWAMLAVVSLVISTLAYPRLLTGGADYRVGDTARADVRASGNFLVEDRGSTEVRRRAASEASLPLYDLDEEALASAIRRLTAATLGASELEKGRPKPGQERIERTEFERLLGMPVEPRAFRALRQSRFDPQIEKAAISLASPIMTVGVGRVEHEQPIIIREVVAGQERQLDDPSAIPDLKGARARLSEEAAVAAVGTLGPEARFAAAQLARALVVPNLSFNKAETELRRARMRERVRPVFFQVKKGETIVREGEKVRPEDLLKLEAERQGKGGAGPEMIVGMGMLLAIFLALTCHVADFHLRHRLFANNKDLLFLCAVLLLTVVMAKATLFVGEAVGRASPYVRERAMMYAMPVSAGAMLVAIFLGLRQALFFALAAGVAAGLLLEGQIEPFLYFYVGSLVGASSVARVRERPALVRAGLVVGVTNMLVVAALAVSSGTYLSVQGLIEAGAGLAGGLVAGVIVVGLTPVVEMAFHYVTDMRLLELINLDQPLLRELAVQAPGTYHHSVVVSNMVEAAAGPVGANALLAKVSAHYHDLGKTKMPQYFIENQESGVNRHEKLTPSMSALVLISHVKDGVELAASRGFDKRIVDIVGQHHGTALISYFYQKAKGLKGNGPVNEADFRYPGPKPQTKEAGLVMLADAVEAACRSLPDPTPDRIQGLVQRIINNIFCDGQLDESELTLRDLHHIAASFNKILCAMHHQRVEYPEVGGRKKGEAEGTERTKSGEDQPGEPEEKDRQNLKRLGMP